MPQITNVEVKTASNGNPFKQVSIDKKLFGNKDRFNLFSDHAMYEDMQVGRNVDEKMLFVNPKGYLELTNPDAGVKKGLGGRRGGADPVAIAMAQERTATHVKTAQDNKDHAIRLSGAMNHAVTIMSTFGDKESTPAEIKEKIINWRNWFLENWEVEKSGEIPL